MKDYELQIIYFKPTTPAPFRFLSTHTAMLDSLGYRGQTSKAIQAHTIGGLAAALVAHWAYMLFMLVA